MKVGLALAIVAAAAGATSAARAQNYPWCANFADGAGTNCGFATLQQCQADVLGSGGYCDRNNLYKPAAAAPAPQRARKIHSGKNS